MAKALKIAYIHNECVACGCCIVACPKMAIEVKYGIKAEVDKDKCIGCGKCTKVCPANVINIRERG